jgi:hypothetical protein
MAAFKKGEVVKLNAVIPSGPVESMRMDEDGNVQYLVSWVDVADIAQSRWFDEAELVAV